MRFTTSKRRLDIQYSKLGIRVVSRVAEQLKAQDLRKLGNIGKISNLGGHIAQCLVSLQELRLCKQQLKNKQKQIPNFSFLVQFYWITPFCSKYFFRDYRPILVNFRTNLHNLFTVSLLLRITVLESAKEIASKKLTEMCKLHCVEVFRFMKVQYRIFKILAKLVYFLHSNFNEISLYIQNNLQYVFQVDQQEKSTNYLTNISYNS